jgi:hypothetical protein
MKLVTYKEASIVTGLSEINLRVQSGKRGYLRDAKVGKKLDIDKVISLIALKIEKREAVSELSAMIYHYLTTELGQDDIDIGKKLGITRYFVQLGMISKENQQRLIDIYLDECKKEMIRTGYDYLGSIERYEKIKETK